LSSPQFFRQLARLNLGYFHAVFSFLSIRIMYPYSKILKKTRLRRLISGNLFQALLNSAINPGKSFNIRFLALPSAGCMALTISSSTAIYPVSFKKMSHGLVPEWGFG